MKYLRLYEDFNWDFDFEEEDDSIHFEVGDVLVSGQQLLYWDNNIWNNTNFSSSQKTVEKIAHSSEVTNNPHDKTPLHIIKDTYVFSVKGYFPWFKYENHIKIK